MRYRLRTLLIVLAVGPVALACMWLCSGVMADLFSPLTGPPMTRTQLLVNAAPIASPIAAALVAILYIRYATAPPEWPPN